MGRMNDTALWEYLEWDSGFFGRRIARAAVHRLDEESAGALLGQCEDENIDCLYFLADGDSGETIRLVESHGFHFVDIRVTLSAQLGARPAGFQEPAIVRSAEERDIPALSAIAATAHRDTRFYYDPHFPDETCSGLYSLWIEKSCQDDAVQVWVAETDGQAAGYITCSLDKDSALGQIGLLGVGERARGRRFAQALIHTALDWSQVGGANEARVATQGRNAAAQRVYERCGFTTHTIQLWYHKWFE